MIRAVSPIVVLLLILSWTLPQAAGARPRIIRQDRALDKLVKTALPDPVDALRRRVEGVRNTAAAVVKSVAKKVPAPAPAPAPATVVVSSPQRSADSRRASGGPHDTRARSSHRRDKDRIGSSNRRNKDSRVADRTHDLQKVASAGNEIFPTEVKGTTITAGGGAPLAFSGVFLLTWMIAAACLIGFGALFVLGSRRRFAGYFLRA